LAYFFESRELICRAELSHRDCRGQAKSLRELRQWCDAVIGGKRHPHVRHSDLMTEEIEEIRQTPVEFERHAAHLRRVRPNLVAENIVGREADHEQVGRRAAPSFSYRTSSLANSSW
jgi:hypothetical protein